MLLRDGSGIYSPDPVLLIPPGDLKSDMTREQYAWSLMAQFEPYFEAALKTGEVQVQEYSIPFMDKMRFFEARIAPSGMALGLDQIPSTGAHLAGGGISCRHRRLSRRFRRRVQS